MIRKAKPSDACQIAPLMMYAMGDIVYQFIGTEDYEKGCDFLKAFIASASNQYSYENIWVYEEKQELLGMINIYDGAELYPLRLPILNKIEAIGQKLPMIEDETQAGEYYIDTIAVSASSRGKGIGKSLLQFAIDYFVVQRQQTLGLLVHIENPQAKKLYENLGFKKMGERLLLGNRLEHLQLQP